MNLNQYEGKYIGEKKIEGIKALKDDKTYLHNKRASVEFKDGDEEEYPAVIMRDIVTDEESDATEVREKRVKPVVEKMLTILTEAELTVEDIDYALNKVQWSVDKNFDSFIKAVIGKEKQDSTLLDWERVINPDD